MFLVLLASIFWTEDFSSKEAAMSNWQGDWSNLTINAREQLQSHVDSAATTYILRSSTASIEAEWSFYARIYGGTSSYNLCRFYILTNDTLTSDGYYVQVGGNNDNIALYQVQNGNSKAVIQSTDRQHLLPQSDAEVYVRLTRDEEGIFHLYSLVEGQDIDYVEEGTYQTDWLPAKAVALYMKNSSKRGHDLYFDDISVLGEEQTQPPQGESEEVRISISGDCLTMHQDSPQIGISYQCPDDTYRANLHVYSDDGRLIRTCCRQQEMDRSGLLVWDGKNDHGQRVEIGVYVLILEITSPSRMPIRHRYPIAVIY